MIEQYKQDIIKHFDDVLSMDLSDSPNYRTMARVRNTLRDHFKMPETLANRVVCKAHIMVSDKIFADDQFMQQVTFKFATVISRIWDLAQNDYQSDECFLDMIDGMSLTLTPQ